MLGLMQNHPLLISSLIDFAARHHGDGQIVSRRVEGDIHRYTWKDVQQRAKQVANALNAEGLNAGDRVVGSGLNRIQPGAPVRVGAASDKNGQKAGTPTAEAARK